MIVFTDETWCLHTLKQFDTPFVIVSSYIYNKFYVRTGGFGLC